jgi:hypothetical protein
VVRVQRDLDEPLTLFRDELLWFGRYAGLLLIGGTQFAGFLLADELVAIVGVFAAALDRGIARLQVPHHLGENAEFEEAPMHPVDRLSLRRVSYQPPSCVGDPIETARWYRQRQPFRASSFIRKNKSECPFKRLILRRRAKLEHMPDVK